MTPTLATPAARLIARYGVQALSRWTGRDRSRIHAWTWPKTRGGTGGRVPHAVRPAIIERARDELNDSIGYADFEPVDGESYLADAPVTAAP